MGQMSVSHNISANLCHTYVLGRERIGARFCSTLEKVGVGPLTRVGQMRSGALTTPMTAMGAPSSVSLIDINLGKKDGRTGAESQFGHLTLEDFLFRRVKN